MPKMTQREMNEAHLLSMGWSVNKITSRKYWVMSHPEKDDKYYLGPAGSVRRGKTHGKSIPMPLPRKPRVEA